jgi:crotonobetainyl-CoA:carnitine CoA-transferase CaiB-like acyl-CoA transferase
MQVRGEHAAACVELIDAALATRPRAEWLTRFAAGGDFIVSVVTSEDDLPDVPRMQGNEYSTTFVHPTFGPTKVAGLPVRLSETPGSLRLPAPEFGQHTEEVLIDLLGYDWDEIARLKDAEVI